MGRFVTFGEVMFRFNPEGYLRIVQATKFEASLAGGEANVAVSLANYGLDTAFVTKVPAHEVGNCVVNEMRRYGVDTRFIVRGGKRLGIFYVEKGASQRPSKVIYDRADSAIATADPSDFDWDTIFDGAEWFHFTGITPALSENMVEACMEACKAAKAHGVTISCDLNYRKKLWTREQACKVMSELMPYVDVCIANEEDASDVFGIQAEHTDIEGGKLDYNAYTSVARQIASRFGTKKVAAAFPRARTHGLACSMTQRLTKPASPAAMISRSLTVLAAVTPSAAHSFTLFLRTTPIRMPLTSPWQLPA
mgnify:CR=1 FL=1